MRDALGWTVDYFGGKDVDSPRRSAEWLLSEATGLSRIELYAAFDRPLSTEERATLRDLVKARAAGTPLQYVTGEVCFRHLVLSVRPGVFIPRPETEVLVDIALEHIAGVEEPLAADICSGSGAVALSIAHEHPSARVWATETVAETAQCASVNAERCRLAERVTVLVGDLLGPLPAELRGRLDTIVANPPYVPSAEMASLPREVAGFEPGIALDGGVDGLDFARGIMVGAREWLVPGGLLALELDTGRCRHGAREAESLGYSEVSVRCDLTGRERFVIARHGKGGGAS